MYIPFNFRLYIVPLYFKNYESYDYRTEPKDAHSYKIYLFSKANMKSIKTVL